jgi:hypothetical protein
MSTLPLAFPQPLTEKYRPYAIVDFAGLEKRSESSANLRLIPTNRHGFSLVHQGLAKPQWLWH